MKREVKALFIPVLAGLLVVLVGGLNIQVKAQNQQPAAAQQPAGQAQSQPKKQDGLVEDWLNDFEDCEDWRAVATCPLGDTKIRKISGKPTKVNDDGSITDQTDPAINLTDDNGITHKNDYVIGVKTYYADRGQDRVEVFPPNEYIIRGKAKEFKVWALGRKFRHTLYIKLRDYRGNIHKLKVGRLDYWGWKELTVIVPGWLPQSASYAMLDKNLHFVSFFVESDQYEVPGTFYTYLDNLRVITDLSEFTGDPSIKDTW